MATVRDLSGNNYFGTTHTDDKLTKPTRTGVVTPIGAVTPAFAGEIYHDTTAEKMYRAHGATSSDWTLFIPE